MARFIYIADPMCSWCYGFGPELSALIADFPHIGMEIVVGGLRAYNTKPMDHELKQKLLTHWNHVAQASGLPFAEQALEREGFVYDTEPACRAVVTARLLVPQLGELPVHSAIQQAFYAEGKDVTRGEVLAEVAALALTEAGIQTTADAFYAVWKQPETRAATREDFHKVQRWGVSGFPTLVLEQEGKLSLLSGGYAKRDMLHERVASLLQ